MATKLEKSSFNLGRRVTLATGVIILSFTVLLGRLWHLQILNGAEFRQKSEHNRLRPVFIPPSRGLMLDRNGKPLVKNRPAYSVELVPEDAPDPALTLHRLSRLIDEEPGKLDERLRDTRKRRKFEPRLLLRDVSRDVVAKVSSRKFDLPGVMINVTPTRYYLYGSLGAHTLGYIREITKEQLELPQFRGYKPGDVVGQFGLEARWEEFLQGVRGSQLVIVNASGARIGEYSYEPERPGHDVTLTLDLPTQQAADAALEGKRGAIVALQPKTGEVLALVSSPKFDPNMFSGDVPADVWKELRSGSGKILNNRAVQGVYPPGSVFKIFSALAAIDQKVISPQERITCRGGLPFGGRVFGCHKREGHGPVNLYDAIVQSCDVYFYVVGQRLGVDRIHDYAVRFGLGKQTGIKLVDEASGLMPSTAWKKKYYRDPANQKWHPGETLSVVIGQGAVTVTPLQIASSIAAVVNGGKVMRPQLVKKISSADGGFLDDDFPPEEIAHAAVDESVLKLITDAMVGVVNDPKGTGKRVRMERFPSITVGGKTGTAQVVALGAAKHEHLEDHAWFVGYAPAENPEIVAVALVENGGGGGANAAPLVKQVFEAYFLSTRGAPEQQIVSAEGAKASTSG
ncbi:MAG: penicillin-binding protein 2 [Bdellovibrionota bacterium]|nr:MAG: penicillin-binding protein 2 [Bdellovibrionota bacterium]